MRFKTRFILLLVLVCLGSMGYGVGRLYFHFTDGFGPGSIATHFPYEPEWEIGSLSESKQAELNQILKQNFHYFAKGTQSYVLLSDDGRYVLKFFKQKHLDRPMWKQTVASIPIIGNIAQTSLDRRNAKRKKIFTGCKIGYEFMQQDSGVVYIHLNPSDDLPHELFFFDKLGRRHQIDPNDTAFYLQKKGVPVHKALLAFKESGDSVGASSAVTALLEYLLERSQRGIEDSDPNLLNNLGFIDGHPATLDLGGLYLEPRERDNSQRKQEILMRTQVIHHWIKGFYPELLPHYTEVAEKLDRVS